MGARTDNGRSSAMNGLHLPRATAQDDLVMNVSPPASAFCSLPLAPCTLIPPSYQYAYMLIYASINVKYLPD